VAGGGGPLGFRPMHYLERKPNKDAPHHAAFLEWCFNCRSTWKAVLHSAVAIQLKQVLHEHTTSESIRFGHFWNITLLTFDEIDSRTAPAHRRILQPHA